MAARNNGDMDVIVTLIVQMMFADEAPSGAAAEKDLADTDGDRPDSGSSDDNG